MSRSPQVLGAVWSRSSQIAWWLPALYAVALGLNLRGPEPLLPDAYGYFAMASDWEPDVWWSGGFREPVWPTLNALPIAIFGTKPEVIQYMGILAFGGMVLATQYLAREVVGRTTAIAVGAVLALSPWLAEQAGQGLREEVAALLTVVVAIGVMRLKSAWRGPLLLALLVGLAAMTRWDTLLLTIPVIAIVFYARRVRLRVALAAVAVVAATVMPFCIANEREFGDPLYHSNIHAVFFRNLELAGTDPDLPTVEEVRINGFAGPRETWAHYLFARHDVGWLADKTARGTVNTGFSDWGNTIGATSVPTVGFPTLSWLTDFGELLTLLLVLATLVGAGYLVLTPAWPIAALTFLTLLQHAPIQHLMDPRLGLSAVPFMVICVAVCVTRAGPPLARRLIARPTQGPERAS